MKRSPLLRKTQLRRTGPPRRLTPIRSTSSRQRAERRAAQPIVDAVMARDGGCLLRNHSDLAGPCFGPLTAHHLLKRSAGGGWTVANIVTLCAAANGWVEDHPDQAHAIGLVIRRGETTGLAWSRMRRAGLPVGESMAVRCDGSMSSPEALRLVVDGRTACLTCGLSVQVQQHPDGGSGPFLQIHEREVRL